MTDFTIHTIDTAPEASKEMLQNTLDANGFIPNLLGVLAEAPEALEGYLTLAKLFQNTSFNNDELTVVWQTLNVENNCHYCVPAHTAIANKMNVAPEITEALRNKTALPNAKLQALHDTTKLLHHNRGYITEAEAEAFYAAGYTQRQLLEIVLGMAHKVMSNFTNHIAHTPLDEAFAPFDWKS